MDEKEKQWLEEIEAQTVFMPKVENIIRVLFQNLDTRPELSKHLYGVLEKYLEENASHPDIELARAVLTMQKGLNQILSSNVDEGFRMMHAAEDVIMSRGSTNLQCEVELRLGASYWNIGDYDKGLHYLQKSHQLATQSRNVLALAWAKYMLGNSFYDLKDYDSALVYFRDAKPFFEEVEEDIGEVRCINGIGDVFLMQKNYKQAFLYIREGFEKCESTQNLRVISRCYNDMGRIYKHLGEYENALFYYEKALEMRTSTFYRQGKITTLLEMGELFGEWAQYEKAIQYLKEAIHLAKEARAKVKLYQGHYLLAEIYKKMRSPWSALEHYELFFKIKEETLGDEISIKLKNVQASYAVEKSQKEAEIYRLRNVELKEAYEEIEKNHADITASINYAKRIQVALLPQESEVSPILKAIFVFFMPKDIVSGDFYWFRHEENKLFIAAIDCTGHGVPGAFMTMLANDMLNTIISESQIHEPQAILHALDQKVRLTLRQDQAESGSQDGMDMGIVCIHLDKKNIQFAGAKSPLIYFKNKELYKIQGSKFPIGSSFLGLEKEFTQHEISYEEGDTFYLFTDGYADQFGGNHYKKFMKQHFIQLLCSLQGYDMQTQKEYIKQRHLEWKKHFSQTDDILVIGFKM